ncbi:MAG: ABC transporter substrate-binding protein [Aerococcaceae bacterium]|nr:ABC transporter substrate-binding protein [Aerococcaceae bacterium]
MYALKKLYVSLSMIVLFVAVLFGIRYVLESPGFATGGEQGERQTLHIFNWGNYVDPDLIKEFEAETNYTVIYETFDSNDAMEAKIKQSGTHYDLIFPSESSVPKLVEQNLLLPLDHTKLIGLDTISPYLLNHNFDRGNRYTVPYFWGTVGIMINTKYIDPSEVTKWSDLWKPEFKNNVLFLDGNRESLGIALQSLGYSLNSTNERELQEAQAKLVELAPNIRAILMEEIKTLMTAEEATIGIGYSGDAAAVIYDNPNIAYVIPEDGSAVWTDNFAIPHSAQNIQGAYDFINFMLRPEIAARNAEWVGYTTPSEAAKALLPEDITSDTAFYPPASILNELEHYEYLGKEWIEKYNELFLTFKMEL